MTDKISVLSFNRNPVLRAKLTQFHIVSKPQTYDPDQLELELARTDP